MMKFTVSRAELVRALSSVERVVESRTTIPILSHVLIRTNGTAIEITGTDLDIQATARVDAEISSPGDITVDAARFSAIAKKAATDIIALEAKDGQVIIKAARSRFTLHSLPPADFPDLPIGATGCAFSADLSALFAQVKFAISTEETRYYLNGIYLHVDGANLAAVATDGHRLARATIVAPSTEIPSVIVPRKLVGMLPKGDLEVSLTSTKIRIASGNLVLISKLIDGTFPDYRRVIPSSNDNVVTVDRSALRSAVDRVATVTDTKGSAVRLGIFDESITLDLASAGSGEASESIDAQLSGEKLQIGLNHKYLSEILGVMSGETVELRFADGGTPVLFSTTGQDNWLGLVMPMRA